MEHMTKKPQNLEHDLHFHMRVSSDFIAMLDDMRTAERPVVSRAEWLRRAVTDAFDSKQRKGDRR